MLNDFYYKGILIPIFMLDDTSSILVNGTTTFKKKKYNKLENGGLSSEK